jgi:hypothetical protein
MALFEDLFKGGNIAAGLAVGIAAAVLAPVIIPALRPIAKSVIKAGLLAYDQARVAIAELNEHTGDIMAEARSELAEVGRSESHTGA